MQRIHGVTAVGAGGSVPFLEQAGGAQDSSSSRVIDGRGTTAEDVGRWPASVADGRQRGLFPRDGYSCSRRAEHSRAEDNLDAPAVALVNKSFAARNWPDGEPLGQQLSANGGRTWFTVVGVVANVRQQLALEPVDEVYAPVRQVPYVTTNWAIRSQSDAGVLAPLVRKPSTRSIPISRSTGCARMDDVRLGLAGAAAPDDGAAWNICRAGTRHHRGRDRRRHRFFGESADAGIRRPRCARRQPIRRRLDGPR